MTHTEAVSAWPRLRRAVLNALQNEEALEEHRRANTELVAEVIALRDERAGLIRGMQKLKLRRDKWRRRWLRDRTPKQKLEPPHPE